MSEVKYDKAKQVITKDLDGRKNGFLIELQKDGRRTTSYLTVALPRCFKGYHLHRVRSANYVCLQGEVEILMWLVSQDGDPMKVTYILKQGDKLHIPKYVPTALNNKSDTTQAWIVNFPDPAYDPDLTDEQVDYTEAECRAGKYLDLLKEDGVI